MGLTKQRYDMRPVTRSERVAGVVVHPHLSQLDRAALQMDATVFSRTGLSFVPP